MRGRQTPNAKQKETPVHATGTVFDTTLSFQSVKQAQMKAHGILDPMEHAQNGVGEILEPIAAAQIAYHNAGVVCEVCNGGERPGELMFCGSEHDGCDDGYHIGCTADNLEKVPMEDWYCPKCRWNVWDWRRVKSAGENQTHDEVVLAALVQHLEQKSVSAEESMDVDVAYEVLGAKDTSQKKQAMEQLTRMIRDGKLKWANSVESKICVPDVSLSPTRERAQKRQKVGC